VGNLITRSLKKVLFVYCNNVLLIYLCLTDVTLLVQCTLNICAYYSVLWNLDHWMQYHNRTNPQKNISFGLGPRSLNGLPAGRALEKKVVSGQRNMITVRADRQRQVMRA